MHTNECHVAYVLQQSHIINLTTETAPAGNVVHKKASTVLKGNFFSPQIISDVIILPINNVMLVMLQVFICASVSLGFS